MKLTTKGRYAVAAMTDLAAHGGSGPTALPEIAVRQGISLSYLEQLFGKLRRAGLVTSARGVAGGYQLSQGPGATRIADIVGAVGEDIQTTACVRGGEIGCTGTTAKCLTHDLWDELGRQIELFLNTVTLEDVLAKRVAGMAAVHAPVISETVIDDSACEELPTAGGRA